MSDFKRNCFVFKNCAIQHSFMKVIQNALYVVCLCLYVIVRDNCMFILDRESFYRLMHK